MAGKTTYITLGQNPQDVAMQDAVTSATDNLVKIAWNKYTPVKPTTDSAVVQQASVEGDSIMQRIESTEDLAIKQRERDLAAYTTGYDYGKMKSDPYYKEVATSKPGKDTTVPAFAQAGVSKERAAAARKKAINEINPIYGDPTAPAQDNPYDAEAKALRKIQAKNVAEEATTSPTYWMTDAERDEYFSVAANVPDDYKHIATSQQDLRIKHRVDEDYPYKYKGSYGEVGRIMAQDELRKQTELLRKAGMFTENKEL